MYCPIPRLDTIILFVYNQRFDNYLLLIIHPSLIHCNVDGNGGKPA